MLPYVPEPVLQLGPVTVTAFGSLVCVGVLVGTDLVARRAPGVGLSRDDALSVVVWTVVCGFVFAHVFDVLVYFPEMLRSDPWELLRVWGSLSSFGGILGGVAGSVVVMRRRGMSGDAIWRFVDLVAFAFPFAWIFGRAGCALRHDHVGVASDHWLAVAFPGGARFDLGLLELFYTLAIAGLFAVLGRRERRAPFYTGLFFALYGPVRFALDALRDGDARYLGWTPAQYLCVVSTLAGIALLRVARRRGRAGPRA